MLNQVVCVSHMYLFFISTVVAKMTKGKSQTVEPSQVRNEVLRWTDDMDRMLLNAFSEEAAKGHRCQGSWTIEAYANVLQALQIAISPTMMKQHIIIRMRALRARSTRLSDGELL